MPAAVVDDAPPVWRRALPFAAAVAVTSLVAGVAAWSLWPTTEEPRVTRLTITPPEAAPLRIDGNDRDLAIEMFNRARNNYHPITVAKVENTLNKTD